MLPTDAAAEARLRRKIDLYTVPTVCVLYLCCEFSSQSTTNILGHSTALFHRVY